MPRLFSSLLICLIALAGWSSPVQARDAESPLLTLTSPNNERPVQFRRIAPGEVPAGSAFASRLDIDSETDPTANVVYVAIANTGWSVGVIGLISRALAPDARYVALEVDAAGSPVPLQACYDSCIRAARRCALMVARASGWRNDNAQHNVEFQIYVTGTGG